MIIASKISDKYNNRGWPSQVGWAMLVVGFAIWLGCDVNNRAAHITALILAEAGHYSEFLVGGLSGRQAQTDSSLHPAHRHLVCQQRRQRVPPSRCRTPCRLNRTGRRVSETKVSSASSPC